ncbi:hypothetical protein GQ53DRAFT_749664 [Thozetella sp. PMI_491]|nr:hypothetical protein GQ53DRAFT_749664 [Thozetella sp. PMI_491]
MFDIFAKLLSSIASFLFPLFASYKALKTSDPAQLTPWLMYWVVLACALLVESWTEWILVWIPFYAYIRLLFLLYLVLPQTQGAKIIYQERIHPWLDKNETRIDIFIADAHEHLRSAGIAYIKRAIELLRTSVLGLPPTAEEPTAAAAPSATSGSYTEALLARFSLPAARWDAATGAVGGAGTDFYNLLASAVSVATGTSKNQSGRAPLIPDSIRGASKRMSFIDAQRERLNIMLSALDREATHLKEEEEQRRDGARATSISLDGGSEGAQQSGSGLVKSRSEPDFERLEAESGTEDMDDDTGVRKRTPAAAGGSWMPWGWGGASGGSDVGKSSGVEH